MGTWGTGILDSDAAMDIHGDYMDRYNVGLAPNEIRKELEKEFASCFENEVLEDNTDFWLGLAQAQWECKALDKDVLDIVARIIKEDVEREAWGERDYLKRLATLKRFYQKIQTTRRAPRKRVRPRLFSPPFKTGDCIVTFYEDGTYGGVLCLYAEIGKSKMPSMITATLRIHQPQKPSLDDFRNSHVLVINCGEIDGEKASFIDDPDPDVNGHFGSEPEEFREARRLEVVGTIPIRRKYGKSVYGWSAGFEFACLAPHQFRWEEHHPESIDLTYPVAEVIGEPKKHADFGRKFVESQQDIGDYEKQCAVAMQALKRCSFKKEDEVYRFIMSYCLCNRERAENRYEDVLRNGSKWNH